MALTTDFRSGFAVGLVIVALVVFIFRASRKL